MMSSVFCANLAWVLLLANWVAEWNWKDKFADFKHNYLLQAFLLLFIVHLLWLAGSANLDYGLFDIQKKLPLVAVPLVMLTTNPLNRRESFCVGLVYVLTVVVLSVIGLIRHLCIPDLPHRELVPFISHIRYGLNVCLSIVLLCIVAMKCRQWWMQCIAVVLALWLLTFLVLLQAFTAFVVLAVIALVLVFAYGSRLPRRRRSIIAASVMAVLFAGLGLAGYYAYDYYSLKPLSLQDKIAYTENGNAYKHEDDGFIENGNYVLNYVCRTELEKEWGRISIRHIDSLSDNGYPIFHTLIRYLNGMGVTKDSVGVSCLSPADVAAIEKGVANPVYLKGGLRKMVYMLCYEYESYRRYRHVNDFSMLQRFELWKNAFAVFREHPVLGVGTGDVVDACHLHLAETDSPLAGTDMHSHNQYLTLLVSFGLLGFVVIVCAFARAIYCQKLFRSVLFCAFFCAMMVSFVSEDTLETLAGILFVAFLFPLLSRADDTLLYPTH